MVYWIIAGITVIIALVLFFKGFLNNKQEQGFARALIASGLGLVAGSFGSTLNEVIQAIAIIKNSKTAQDSINITNEMSQTNYPELVTGIILVLGGVYFLQYVKKKLYILNINGYEDKRIEGHNQDVRLGSFEFKERDIDFIRLYRKGVNADSAKEIIQILQEKVKSFKDESTEFKRGYTGIAPIPFVMMAGTFLAKERIDEYLEFDKKETQKYYRLVKGNDFPPLQITDFNTINQNAEDVVIAITLTTKITNADLSQFNGFPVVRVSVPTPQDNVIRYKQQLIEYKSKIADLIEDIGANLPLLKRVHVCCASQSCLVLELGKEIDNRRMQQVISYHFYAQGQHRYPWGIVINGHEKGKLIQA
ncbi:SAVED domain-containing protein (plasmid) [Aneurinibacillus sp. Ricciae_BoGa-3]|uniref:SAVED domain-containing protein n=1 Tax=Aneurinibacillus sp. Ricciae_BoGa-3 TaxID=3022697 RepID=UPI00234079F1|nr:SAVED domain-containing protein [Aneurinibacillus sp. Ricciae_BoGa-3]WCK57138.1 SAVED domain-containing protein [Aneurinibacillus sp. Ricciae_BoGa-3]